MRSCLDMRVQAMATITKKELIERIAQRCGLTRAQTRAVVQMFLDEIIAELGRKNRIEFRDFGVFEIQMRAPRTARNPRTREPVPVPAKPGVRFKAGRLMKQTVERDIPEIRVLRLTDDHLHSAHHDGSIIDGTYLDATRGNHIVREDSPG